LAKAKRDLLWKADHEFPQLIGVHVMKTFKKNVMKTYKKSRVRKAAVASLLLISSAVWADTAVLSVTSGNDGCYDLLAGQTIDAGDVCFAVEGDSLTVTYTTRDGWQLGEAHVWVGEDQDGYPQAKNGNPKIGNFPYNAGDITGATTYSFSVPLGNVQTMFDLENLSAYCAQSGTIYAMAHAVVELADASGNLAQTETGWGEGEGAVQKGSWATRSAITLSVTCNDAPPPPPPSLGQETALMFGNIELNDGTDGICDAHNNSERWGWQAGPLSVGYYQNEIWAGAGQNDLSKGTLVGYVDIVVSDEPAPGNVIVTPMLLDGFTALSTNIYIGREPVCSAAFGKDWRSNASTDIDTSGGVYVGGHFSVGAECQANGNFCE
jgi:hypothetical protein